MSEPSDVELPCNIEAEQAVLGGLMGDASAAALVSDWLTPDDFFRKDHGLIYRAICELADRGEKVDAVSVGEYFELNRIDGIVGGTSYVLTLHAMSTGVANIHAHAEIVLSRSRLRRLHDIGTKLSAHALRRGADAERIAAQCSAVLGELNTVKPNCGLQPISVALKAHAAEMNSRYAEGRGGVVGLATPWAGLNKLTKGLRKGVVYIVCARPSMGKSVFGMQLAGFVALNGTPAALFSVEMGKAEIAGRQISCFGQIPHEWVDDPVGYADAQMSEVYWERYFTWQKELAKAPLVVDDQAGLRIPQLKARAIREDRKRELGLIVIDHLHDMGVERGPGHEYRHELGLIVQGGKELAKDLDVPVVILAQLNRAAATRTDPRPTMTDLRESGEIEQKADVIIGMHRPDYYDRDTHLKGVVELIPLKGRNLPLSERVHLQNRFDQMRLDDWEGPLPEAPAPPPKSSNRTSARGNGRGGLSYQDRRSPQ